jgi:hypothetical protein
MTVASSAQPLPWYRTADFTLPPYYLPVLAGNARHQDAQGVLCGSSGMYFLALVRLFTAVFNQRRYRPELHYMRGRGPKWHERHDR